MIITSGRLALVALLSAALPWAKRNLQLTLTIHPVSLHACVTSHLAAALVHMLVQMF